MNWLETLASNPVFAGIAGGAGMSAVLYQARALPARLWEWTKAQTMVVMTLENDQNLLDKLLILLTESDQVRSARRLRMVEAYSDETQKWEWRPTFGGGWHLFRAHGKWFMLHRDIQPMQGSIIPAKREVVTLQTFGRSQVAMRALMASAEDVWNGNQTVRVYVWNGGGYLLADRKAKRSFDTIFIPDDQRQRLIEDVELFVASREEYRRKGIPWRRGYLLKGPPGTGKTTLAFALAGRINRPIYAINLATAGGDTGLQHAFNQMEAGAVVVIEDIDANEVTHQRTDEKMDKVPVEPDKAVTLAGLLNAIDGLASRENRILIVTSNHAEKLDAALVRPGRIDVTEEIGLIENEVVAWDMTKLFLGTEERAWFDSVVVPQLPISPASLQALLLERAKEVK